MKKRPDKKHSRSTNNRFRSRPGVAVLILVSLGIVAYWNSFDAPFVFDDLFAITMNSQVQFGGALLPTQIWSRALLFLTFAANHSINGENVWGYHLVNLLLHLLNGLLVYLLARNIFSRTLDRKDLSDLFALLAAAFFIVHPVQTESVTYISSRSELLSTLFYVGAVVVFARTSPDRIGFLFSLIISAFFVLGIGAKETVISLPATLFLYDFIFFSGGRIREVLSRWRFYATFLVGGLALGFYLVTEKLRSSVGGAAPGNLPAYQYFLTELRVIVRYVQITFMPTGLNLAYDFRPSTSFIEPGVILSALFLVGLVGMAWWLRQKKPVIAFSIFWFFITLAPTSSLVSVLDVIYDHRLYLPMVGTCLSFPLLIEFLQRFVSSRMSLRVSVPQIGTALILTLTIGTLVRNEVWRDEIRLWSDVIAKSPAKARGYSGLAQAYFMRGQYDKAIEISRQGLQNVHDNGAGFYNNIGQFCLGLRRYDEATDAFSKAVERAATPLDRAHAYHNMAMTDLYKLNALKANDTQVRERLLGMAEEALLKSIELDNGYLPSWDSYINVSIDRGKQEILRGELQQQVRNGVDPRAYYGLGKLAFQQGNFKEAASYFKQAANQYKGEKMFLLNYALALEETGDSEGAIESYLAALSLDPLFIEANTNLALLYMEKGQYESAIQHFEQVLRNDAGNTIAHLQLARIYIKQGQRGLARNHLSAVLNVSPGNPEATALWQQTL